jgi:hypothetical protein
MQRSSSDRPSCQYCSRCLALCAALLALWVAESAGAAAVEGVQRGRYTSQCKRLTRQIGHYESVAQTAKARGDRLWFNGTVAHMQRLADRRARLCPEERPNYVLMMTKWFGKTAKAAGRSFVKYLTFGAY